MQSAPMKVVQVAPEQKSSPGIVIPGHYNKITCLILWL